MDASGNKAEYTTALKVGLVCGIVVAIIELYSLLVGLGSTSISTSIYQTLWLLGAFVFAMAGVWAVRRASTGINNLSGAILHSGLAGAVAGILYIAAVIIVEFVTIVADSLRYFYMASFIGDVIGAFLSSLLWLPVAVAVAIFGGVVYYTLTK